MQQQATKTAALSGGSFQRMGASLDSMRGSYLNQIRAMSAFDVRTGKVVSQTESFTRALREQKVHIGDLIKNHKLMNSVIKDQIDLRRAYAVSWRKDDQGRILGDLIIPKDSFNSKGFRAEMSKMRAILGSYSAAFRSASDQMVKWGKNTQWAGRQLMVGFTVPMGIAAAATGKMAFDVDKALTQITKVYGDATTDFQDSTETIREAAWNTAKNMTNLYGQAATDTLEIEAQFAAAGKQGVELQQATAAATRARMLNEIDLQTAIDASITMQTVYGYSAEELAEKWDYINAVANQTILSAEDFAVAIPKVAGVIHQLGGTLEDVGTLMAGFRAAGIDAAEGANALKTISFRSVAAYDKGLQTFKQNTGRDLQEIIKTTNGETIPTLTKMWEAMADLTVPQRVKVVKDVFGIYQGNKALMLLQQLAQGGEQVTQAMAVGMNSVADNALIANQELQRMNDQPYKKIEKAFNSIKNAMADIGAEVLPVVAWLTQGIASVIKSFSEWHGALKGIALGFGLLAAAAGPITMIIGLFGNLFGNIGKLVSGLGVLATRWKFVSTEERMAALVGKQAEAGWDRQTTAVHLLTGELQKMNMELANYRQNILGGGLLEKRSILNAAGATGAPLASKRARDSRGVFTSSRNTDIPTVIPGITPSRDIRSRKMKKQANNFTFTGAPAGGWYSADTLADTNKALDAQNKLLAIQAQRHLKIAQNIGAAASAASFMTAMFTDSPVMQTLSGLVFLSGMLVAQFPAIGVSLVKNFTTPFKAFGGILSNNVKGFDRFKGAIKSTGSFAKTAFSGIGSILKGSMIPLTIAVAGIAYVWKKAKDDAEEAANRIKAVGESTKQWSEIFGYNELSPSKAAESTAKSGQDLARAYATQFREANAEAADFFYQINKGGASIEEKWAVAINEGLKVKLTGGTVDAAKQATRAALQMMGQEFDNEDEFNVEIDARINFDNLKKQIDAVTGYLNVSMKQALADSGTGMDAFARKFFSGDNDLTQAASAMAQNAATEFWMSYQTMDRKQRAEFINETDRNLLQPIVDMYKKSGYDASMSFSEFFAAAQAGELNMNVEDIATLGKAIDYYNQFGDATSRLAGIDTPDFHSLISELDPPYMKVYGQYLMDAARAGVEMNDQLQLQWLNSARARYGLGPLKDVTEDWHFTADGAAKSTEELAGELDKLARIQSEGNFQTSVDQMISSYRSVIQGVQSDAVDYAVGSLDAESEAALAAFDANTKAVEDGFDDASDRLEEKQDAQMDRFEKRWDKRKANAENYYDSRIKKIEEEIDAEQKADDLRQRMFEKEKTRLERLADMYNRRIDINSAITTGNFDEAAKMWNDARAQQDSWSLEDAAAAAGQSSQDRIDKLNDQKDYWENAKDVRMDVLDQQMKAEEDALKKRQEMEKKALQKTQDLQKEELDSKRTNLQRQWEARKRALQIELETVRAYVPRNEEELNRQIARIKTIYAKYGKNLKANGKDWSTAIADSMTTQVARAGRELKTEVRWANIGNKIANQMLKGGFGMTPTQFAQWLNGGKAPAGTIFGPPKSRISTNQSQGGVPLNSHKGSILSRGMGGGDRTGHTGQQDHSEVWVNALYGEAILNKKATDWLGPQGVSALNSRSIPSSWLMDPRMPKNTGGWMEPFSGMAAAGTAGTVKNLMGLTLGSYGFTKDKYKDKYQYDFKPTVQGGGGIANLPPNSGGWIKPLKSYIVTSEWGMRTHPITGERRLHGGIDMAAPTGTPIYASKSGRVTMSGMYPGWGNYVRIAHSGGFSTGYAHQERIFARDGQYVQRGQKIGLVDSTGSSTGPHLHFEEYFNGQNINPRNIIPRLMDGGYTYNTGIAELHPRETVLSAPLSQDLKDGLNNLASGQNTGYNVTVDLRGSSIKEDVDIEGAIKRAFEERDRIASRGRRVGRRG